MHITLYMHITFPQAWNVKDGHEISSSSGRGLGVRPCVFFSDNVRVASAADNEVLVSTCTTCKWYELMARRIGTDLKIHTCIHIHALLVKTLACLCMIIMHAYRYGMLILESH